MEHPITKITSEVDFLTPRICLVILFMDHVGQ